ACRTRGVARHDGEQLLTPSSHTGVLGHIETLRTEEVRRVLWPDAELGDGAFGEAEARVRFLHEAVAEDDLLDTAAEVDDFGAFLGREARNVLGADRQDVRAIVEDL